MTHGDAQPPDAADRFAAGPALSTGEAFPDARRSASRTVVPTATSRAARPWLDFRRRVLQAVPAPNTYRGSGVEPVLDVVAVRGDALETTTCPCAGAFKASGSGSRIPSS
jgi:hypothetical protein